MANSEYIVNYTDEEEGLQARRVSSRAAALDLAPALISYPETIRGSVVIFPADGSGGKEYIG